MELKLELSYWSQNMSWVKIGVKFKTSEELKYELNLWRYVELKVELNFYKTMESKPELYSQIFLELKLELDT